MTYTNQFYTHRHETTSHTAEAIIPILLRHLTILSAVDVGCGVGTFLHALNIRDILGIDGKWVDRKLLVIPRKRFMSADLNDGLNLARKYDLAICLEVAEHLPPHNSVKFIKTLTALSDNILFSAAIPFQTGNTHINERWQSYWGDIFKEEGYKAYDFIRPEIWDDREIPFWYRQNTLFYSKQSLGEVAKTLDIVHPEAYLVKVSLNLKK